LPIADHVRAAIHDAATADGMDSRQSHAVIMSVLCPVIAAKLVGDAIGALTWRVVRH
jgi:hypothetical protein